MHYSLFFRTDASILSLILLAACIFMVRFGRFVRNKFFRTDQQESKGGVNSLLGALFGLSPGDRKGIGDSGEHVDEDDPYTKMLKKRRA